MLRQRAESAKAWSTGSAALRSEESLGMNSCELLVGALRQETKLARCFREGTEGNVTSNWPAGHAEAASEAETEKVEHKIRHLFCLCSLKRDLQK